MNNDQLRQLQQAINDRYEWIAAQMQSVEYQPDPAQLERWQRLGLVPEEITPATFASSIPAEMHLIRNAFIMGRVADAVEQGQTFEEVMQLALTLPLRKPDVAAIAIAEQQTAMYLRDNAADLATKVGQLAIKHRNDTIRQMAVEYHNQTLVQTVRDEAEKQAMGEAIPHSQVNTWQKFSSELHGILNDKARDIQRVAYYEITDAAMQGKAHRLMKESGSETYVYKMPLPTACPQCKHAYLLKDGKTPRVFKLSTLLMNGTNIGRKPFPTKGGKVVPEARPDGTETMKPVSGLMHPWCACQLYEYTGYEPWAIVKKP